MPIEAPGQRKAMASLARSDPAGRPFGRGRVDVGDAMVRTSDRAVSPPLSIRASIVVTEARRSMDMPATHAFAARRRRRGSQDQPRLATCVASADRPDRQSLRSARSLPGAETETTTLETEIPPICIRKQRQLGFGPAESLGRFRIKACQVDEGRGSTTPRVDLRIAARGPPVCAVKQEGDVPPRDGRL